jgi:hypothetical protein
LDENGIFTDRLDAESSTEVGELLALEAVERLGGEKHVGGHNEGDWHTHLRSHCGSTWMKVDLGRNADDGDDEGNERR